MKRILFGLLLLCTLAPSLRAQTAEDDPIARKLFEPELVMTHQNEIGLSQQQRQTIRTVIREVQGQFVDLQWQLQDESEKMGILLEAQPIDELQVLGQADVVMGLEREIKKRSSHC